MIKVESNSEKSPKGEEAKNSLSQTTFLPLIYEIIHNLERDPHDISQKNVQAQDISQKVMELQQKLQEARNLVCQLPGIEYNKQEQKERLSMLRDQLKSKNELILKYKHMYSSFDDTETE